MSKDRAFAEFLDTFDVPEHAAATKQEFLAYHANVSAAVANDAYFSALVRGVWRPQGGADYAPQAESARRPVALSTFKGRLKPNAEAAGRVRPDGCCGCTDARRSVCTRPMAAAPTSFMTRLAAIYLTKACAASHLMGAYSSLGSPPGVSPISPQTCR